MRQLLAAAIGLAFLASPALAAPPKVVATTKPIHSLVAAVMGDLGTPTLLVKGAASPHSYSLRPSDAAALESADVVFWTGPGMERFLENSLSTLAPKALAVDLSTTPSLYFLPVREVGPFEPHEHEGEEHHDEHGTEGERDMHYWLDPVQAIHMVDFIAEKLSAADPDNYETYGQNASAVIDGLFELRDEINAIFAPLSRDRFVLLHDATQYFEYGFVMEAAGSLSVSPDAMPGAQRIIQLREKIKERTAECVFADTQFEPAIVSTLIEGTPARAATIDPEGILLTEGPGLYREMLLGLANSFADCFR